MNVVRDLARYNPPDAGLALSIGNFDGVHRGHQRIIETVRDIASEQELGVAVMTFEPHPLEVVAPDHAPPRLSTITEKLALFERCGVQTCFVLRSEPDLLGLEPRAFLEMLVRHCQPRALVEGADFNFGRKRAGNIDTLREFADHFGYSVHVVQTAHYHDASDHPIISSSAIRQAIRDGQIEDVAAMLGRPYRIAGSVGSGQGRGGPLGIPTANVEKIPHLLPREAVYAAAAQTEDGKLHLAAVNIGPQPTFAQMTSRVEAHLLDFENDVRAQPMALYLFSRLRDQMKFSTPQKLLEQIDRDITATRACAGRLEHLRANLLPL